MNLKLTIALALIIANCAPIHGMEKNTPETPLSPVARDMQPSPDIVDDIADIQDAERVVSPTEPASPEQATTAEEPAPVVTPDTKTQIIQKFLQRNTKNIMGAGLLSALAWYIKTHPESLKLTTKNSMLLGALSTVLAGYTWEKFYTSYAARAFTTKIESIALAFDAEHTFKAKKQYTITVDLQNKTAPITITEQAKRDEKNPFRVLLPAPATLGSQELPVESGLMHRYKQCAKALGIAVDTIYRDPSVLIGPVATTLVAVMGRQSSHKAAQATAAVSALSLVAFSAQQFMRKFKVETEFFTRKNTILNAINQIIEHARTYQTDLKKLTYSVAFDFEANTTTIMLELPSILTQDTLPPYKDAKACQLKVPTADSAAQTAASESYPRYVQPKGPAQQFTFGTTGLTPQTSWQYRQ